MNEFKIKDVTFVNSKKIPFQRWYPYIEGYSPNFVIDIIRKYCHNPHVIYEPFAGTGTTIFASDYLNLNCVYSEVNPLLRFLIDVKISIMSMEAKDRIKLSQEVTELSYTIINKAKRYKISSELDNSYKAVFGSSVYFSEEQFCIILKLRSYIDKLYKTGSKIIGDIVSVAVFSCLLSVSYLKRQGDVRFKTDKEKIKDVKYIQLELPRKISEIAEDIANLDYTISRTHTLLTENAKDIGNIEQREISDVITSPPYLNGTNYFRNTKLELWFLKYLKSDKDLRMYRDFALTSGINDVKQEYEKSISSIESDLYQKTIKELEDKAYDKRIPLMAKCYFSEMLLLFKNLKKHLIDDANIVIDLGDSIFSGVHIKTDFILVDVLKNLGYILNKRITLRERRSKNGEVLSQVLLVFKYKKNI